MKTSFKKVKSLINRLIPTSPKIIPGAEPLQILSLVSPLRYDVLLRLEFFKTIDKNFLLCQNEYNKFLELAKTHVYYTWFLNIFCKFLNPHLLVDEETLLNAFDHRVRKSIHLYSNFKKSGFDPKFPVMLRSGKIISPTSSGKHIQQCYFLGDGCHRIALLLFSGETVLWPEYYQTQMHYKYSPLDNTQSLLPALSITRNEYYAFLAKGYGNGHHLDKEMLLEQVKKNNPSRFNELLTVIEKDEPLI